MFITFFYRASPNNSTHIRLVAIATLAVPPLPIMISIVAVPPSARTCVVARSCQTPNIWEGAREDAVTTLATEQLYWVH